MTCLLTNEIQNTCVLKRPTYHAQAVHFVFVVDLIVRKESGQY